MFSKLFKILNNNQTDAVFHSHVSMINPKGRYQLNRQSIEAFWQEYCDIIQNTVDPPLGIAEKSQHYLPILVDLDIKVKDDDDIEFGNRLYTDEQLLSVISIYQNVIRRTLDGIQEENLYCFVLEKPAYTINGYLKNGFHLHFPYTFASRTDQEIEILPRVKKAVNDAKIFENLGFKDSGNLIDDGYLKAPWLLYGSKKDENMRAYKLTRVIDAEGNEITLQKALQEYILYNCEEEPITFKGQEEYYLPRILSILPFNRKSLELKQNLLRWDAEMKQNKKQKEIKEVKYVQAESVKESLEKVREILNYISSSRAEDYHEWMDIGWTLYNISEGDPEGLSLWIEFSSRCPDKFDEDKCVQEWNKMIKKNKTLGTLKYYANLDSPEEFKKYKQQKQVECIQKNIESFSHNDIAKYLFEEWGNKYKCASIGYDVWYEFEDHHWVKIDDANTLREKISDDCDGSLINTLKNLGKELGKKAYDTDDTFQKNIMFAQVKSLNKIINNLKSHPFKTNVIKECKEVFYDRLFAKQLDRNPFLVGFKNGVYDLKSHTFRPGFPDDYISLQMPINYNEFQDDDRRIDEVHKFLEKIFPDKSVRDYFMDVTAEVFVGGNHAKKVWFWSGEGDNGKSVTQTLFEKMLGEYAVKLPTSLLVGKRTASSSACPELVRAGNGVRWAVLQEPDKKDVINIGILKELSGNDSFYARGLFKEGGEMEPMFKLVVICNDPPQIPYSDRATWNRIRVIPFESTFTDNPPEDPAEQLRQKKFPIDRNFNEKIPDMIQAFAYVLLQHRRKGLKRVEPDKVTLATNSYKIKNDVYRQFIEECIAEDPNSSLAIPELYAFFKNWYKDSLPHHVVPIKNEVKEYFIKLWGEPEGTKWRGFKISDVNEELENGEAFLITKNDLVDYTSKDNPANLL